MIVGLLQFLSQIRTILLWVLIGVILAVALQPAVGWLVRHRWNRILASLLVSFATVAVLVAVVVVVAWPVVQQSDDFIRALPSTVDNVFKPGGALNYFEVKFHVLERLSRSRPARSRGCWPATRTRSSAPSPRRRRSSPRRSRS